MPDVPFAPLPLAVVFSEDDFLRESVALALRERAYVVCTSAPARLRSLLHEGTAGGPGAGDPVLFFYDLRLTESPEVFAEILGPARSRVYTVAIGRPGSSPFAAAEEARLYRCVDYRTLTDARAVAAVADVALDRINLLQENQLLRAELARARAGSPDPLLAASATEATTATPLALRQIVRPTRLAEGNGAVFENIVGGVADALSASRTGLYHHSRGDEPFRLRAGRHVLDPGLEFGPEDPLARWLERFRQPVTRRAADALGDGAARMLLRRALDLLGAETLVPLVVRGGLAGWVFAGAGFAGGPSDFHSLQAVAEQASAALENHTVFEEATLQKTLVESVLGHLPAAIIAVEPDGTIRWANARAEALFPVLTGRHRAGRPMPIIEDVSGRLAGLVHSALAEDDPPGELMIWEHNLTARTYSARAYTPRAAGGRGEILGVFAVIEDITADLAARLREDVAARQALCADLAAGLAHEIRNPLVTLKTFSQLLPQRHGDGEFREEFGSLIERDVDRLDGLLEQLDRFARTPKPGERRSVHVVEILKAAEDAVKKIMASADPRVKLVIAGRQLGVPGTPGTLAQANAAQLPLVNVDPAAVVRALTALFINGVEAAVRKGVIPVLTVDVVRYGADRFDPDQRGAGRRRPDEPTENADRGLRLSIADNGPGIAADDLPRVFSPFFTTKAQGLGLGLPTAQGIILEHGGRMELDSGSRGLCVHVVLPLR